MYNVLGGKLRGVETKCPHCGKENQMKKLLAITGLLLLATFLVFGGFTESAPNPVEPESVEPKSVELDIPQYTVDQIIAMAQATYPEISLGTPGPSEQLAWETTYLGNGIWMVYEYEVDHFGTKTLLQIYKLYEDESCVIRLE
jgi:hypothetical protein